MNVTYLFRLAEYRLNSEATMHTAPNARPYGHTVFSIDNKVVPATGTVNIAPLDATKRTNQRTFARTHGDNDSRNPQTNAIGNVT